MTYFFTADEHYGHYNIIKYCKRPFKDVQEMDKTILLRHNQIVSDKDVVIHAGDFTFKSHLQAKEYIKQLNGNHIFLKGSHDKWMNKLYSEIWEKRFDGQLIVVCHYAMRTWASSHYNSWQLFGHSHGTLSPIGKQWDIGVDNNNFYPLSFEKIRGVMAKQPDNPNLIKNAKDSQEKKA